MLNIIPIPDLENRTTIDTQQKIIAINENNLLYPIEFTGFPVQ